jgi:hypothetical protein
VLAMVVLSEAELRVQCGDEVPGYGQNEARSSA